MVKHSPDDLNSFARDGFTALQLACYFNHEALAFAARGARGGGGRVVAHHLRLLAVLHRRPMADWIAVVDFDRRGRSARAEIWV